MFFRRRDKSSVKQSLEDLAKTFEMVDALVEEEKNGGRMLAEIVRPPLPRIEPRLHVVAAD